MGIVKLLQRLRFSNAPQLTLPAFRLDPQGPVIAQQMQAILLQRGYDQPTRQALQQLAGDFVAYRQEALGGLSHNAFDIAFFEDESALVIYVAPKGLVFQATTAEDAEARLQEEKEVRSRFARHWRPSQRIAS